MSVYRVLLMVPMIVEWDAPNALLAKQGVSQLTLAAVRLIAMPSMDGMVCISEITGADAGKAAYLAALRAGSSLVLV